MNNDDIIVVDISKEWPQEDQDELRRWSEDVLCATDNTIVVPPRWDHERSTSTSRSRVPLMGIPQT